jgi:hypothetical protein
MTGVELPAPFFRAIKSVSLEEELLFVQASIFGMDVGVE